MKPVSRAIAATRRLFDSPGLRRQTARAAASWRFNPLDRGYVADPYRYLAQLQDEDPVHKSRSGAWVLTRYEDVAAALGDARLGNQPSEIAVVHRRNRERYVCADVANNILPFIDPPDHTEPRRQLSNGFLSFMRTVRPDLEQMATAQLHSAQQGGKFDALEDFATPFAVNAIARVMDIPAEDAAGLKRLSAHFFYLFSMIPSSAIRDELNLALSEFRDYLRSALAARRKLAGNDLLSMLSRSGMSDEQVVDNSMLLFADGVENVNSGIANALHALLSEPAQWAQLCAEPSLLDGAVEECLRFESPGQFIGRVALEDIRLHDTDITRGNAVLLVIGAANRDPRHFDEPHQLDIHRHPNPHLAFGKGLHACVGASLVRAEMAAALRAVIQVAPGLTLAEPEPTWEARLGHRWLGKLPVSID